MTDPFDKPFDKTQPVLSSIEGDALRTQRQTTILAYIRACDEAGDLPPTIREIMDELGISSSSLVSSDLDTLQREGYIKRLRDTSRGIRLTDKGRGPGANAELGKLTRQLAEIVQVHQVQIADLQAEVVRLRAMIEPSKDGPSNADWQRMNREAAR